MYIFDIFIFPTKSSIILIIYMMDIFYDFFYDYDIALHCICGNVPSAFGHSPLLYTL